MYAVRVRRAHTRVMKTWWVISYQRRGIMLTQFKALQRVTQIGNGFHGFVIARDALLL